MTSEAPSVSEDEVRAGVNELVQRYRELKAKKKEKGLKDISEADVRADFIDPLFEILGWNVKDPDEYNREKYVRGAGLADIALMLEERPVAFVEAKRFQSIPPVNRQEIDWIEQERQVMNYAMGQGIKWAVLTNFEKLRVFNALNGNLIFSIEEPHEYAEKVKYLLLLSKESFEKGTIKRFEAHEERPDIDLGFLEKLNRWRKMLANSIYELNKDNGVLMEDGEFSMERLKSAVQRLLDRMIIVRYAEDRLILDRPDQLMMLKEAWEGTKAYTSLYETINRYFTGFDRIHDSRIFEGGHICEKVRIDDEVLGEIIGDREKGTGLYSVNFRKFDFDILGNTYETYLGNTLAFDEEGKISLKPAQETRKKSGIYYTPPYVVDYIVKNTLGELLKGKSPDEIGKVRVLDPACGSGSFLIKAYDYFVRFYEEENEKIDEKKKELLREIGKNGNGLSDYSALEGLKKYEGYEKEILLNNIYGVDLDEHAAEIASVNLMLKALKQKEKLPLILGDHIKVGNSLISGDEETLKRYFGENWKEKRSFNWEDEFPEVFQGDNPGFDVIIGNPPYEVLSPKERNDEETEKDIKYLRDVYGYQEGKLNTYRCFLEKSLKLLKKGGLLGFIMPSTLLCDEHAKKLRGYLLENFTIQYILEFPEKDKVFPNVTQDVSIVICKKVEPRDDDKIKISINPINTQGKFNPKFYEITYKDLREIGGETKTIPLTNSTGISILKKMHKNPPLKGEEKIPPLGEIYQGEVNLTVYKSCLSSTATNHPLVRGDNIFRYGLMESHSEKERYIQKEKFLEMAKGSKKSTHHELTRIGFQEVANMQLKYRIKCALIPKGTFLAHTVNYIISEDENKLKFIMALLNSKLLNWRFKLTSTNNHVSGNEIRNLPIPRVSEEIDHELSALADKMLSLNERLSKIDVDFERHVNRRPRIKDARLGDYLDMDRVETFRDAKGMDTNRIPCDGKTCKVRGVDVEEQGDELIFSVELEEVGKNEEKKRRKLRIFGAKIECEAMRNFVYFSFKTFVKPSNVGKGGVYDKLLKVKLPRFENSDRKNREVIHELMDEYLPRLEEWNEIKREIDETDAEIDSKVYELYGLNEDEIRIVEESFGDD